MTYELTGDVDGVPCRSLSFRGVGLAPADKEATSIGKAALCEAGFPEVAAVMISMDENVFLAVAPIPAPHWTDAQEAAIRKAQEMIRLYRERR